MRHSPTMSIAFSLPAIQGRLRTWRKPQAVFLAPEPASTHSTHSTHGNNSANSGLVPDHGPALLAWRDWAQAHVGQRCTVGLSSRWLLHTLVPQAEGPALTKAQALEAASQQWQHYMGLSPSDLDAQWLLRPTAVPGGWLVAACPRTLVADLLAVAQGHAVQVHWMGPWWAQGLQAWLQKKGPAGAAQASTLAMVEPAWAIAAQAQAGELQRLWAQPTPSSPASERLVAPIALGALA